MTAEAMLCRHLLQPEVNAATLAEANKFLMEGLPNRQATDVYYWYYGTLALRFGGGRSWQSWNEVLQTELLASQQSTGRLAGSWHPDATWGSFGGRVYQTALSTLCLEAYYRYDTAKLEGVSDGLGNTILR
jgi:hypothetical protein